MHVRDVSIFALAVDCMSQFRALSGLRDETPCVLPPCQLIICMLHSIHFDYSRWPRTREIFPSNDAGFVCGLIPVHDCAMTRSWCYPQAYLVYHPTLRLNMAPESKGYEDLSCIVLNQLKPPFLGSGGSHHPTLSRCPSLCSWDRVAEIREYSVRWARRDRYWGETWRNGTLDRFEIQQHVFCE